MEQLATITDGMLFGILDNGVLIAGAYTGLELDGWIARVCKGRTRPGLGAIIGAAIGNLASDVAGCMVDPSMLPMIGGIAIGCRLPMLAIPAVEHVLGIRSRRQGLAS